MQAQNQEDSFSYYKLQAWIISQLIKLGYHQPTPIQSLSFHCGLSGKSIIAQSNSGTGKTLAYSAIVLNSINKSLLSIQALILVPTRELAVQVFSYLAFLVKNTEIQVALCIGGLPVQEDRESIERGVQIVCGTLGRVQQLIKEGKIKMAGIKVIVLDEADKMCEKKNLKIVKQIFNTLGEQVQKLAYSATFTEDKIIQLENIMPNAEIIQAFSKNQKKSDNTTKEEFKKCQNECENVEEEVIKKIKIDESLNLYELDQYKIDINFNEQENQDIYQDKIKIILALLNNIAYNQAIIFYNEKIRGEQLQTDLKFNKFKFYQILEHLIQSSFILMETNHKQSVCKQ